MHADKAMPSQTPASEQMSLRSQQSSESLASRYSCRYLPMVRANASITTLKYYNDVTANAMKGADRGLPVAV
jgi:hypothetical protein